MLQTFVMGKIRKQLFFELGPVAAGNNRHLDNAKKRAEKCCHLSIKR